VPDLEFEKAMKAEHCTKGGCDFEFENLKKRKKTSKREWALVVDREPLISGEDSGGRKIPNIDDLTQLPMTVKANLLKMEIIAMVLYTGPMVSFRPSDPDLRFLLIFCVAVIIDFDPAPRSTSSTTQF
jgi:hypothetical protein